LECAQRNPQARANLRHDGDGGPQNDLDDVVVAEQRRDDEQGAEEVDLDVHDATRRTAVAHASGERQRGGSFEPACAARACAPAHAA